MNLETFFEKFELFADAPDAVGKMRELVLELALQGRLVTQDANDEPASELLKQIKGAREELSKRARGKATGQVQLIPLSDAPYKLPSGWEWCTLGSLGLIGSSSRVHQKDWKTSGVPFLRAREIVKLSKFGSVDNELFISEEHFLRLSKDGLIPEPNDFMITGVGTIGVPYLVRSGDRFYFKDASVLILKNCYALYPHYIQTFLRSPYWSREIHRESMGTTVHTLTIVRANSVKIPLPPLAEQKRIVVKVEELMAFCDRLEGQQQERATRHAALARASLSRFAEAPTPAHLDLLFHRSYDIAPAELRKAILILAIQGKLVPQDHNDGSADVSVRRNEKLGARPPFELPEQWNWSQLGELADINGGFAFKSHDYTTDGMRVVRISDFDEFGFKDHKVVRHPFSSELRRFTLAENNILMAMTGGTVGKSYFVKFLPEPMVVNQRVATIKVSVNVDPSYIDIVIRSEMTQEVIQNAKNSTNDNISMGEIKAFTVPVPPLAEQCRIVAKVEQLMALVDRLEAQLSSSRESSEKLLEAVVGELTNHESR